MFFITMDKNTIFAKLFRLTPFSHDIPAFVDFMAEYGHTITPSQVNCWQRKKAIINLVLSPNYSILKQFASEYLNEQISIHQIHCV